MSETESEYDVFLSHSAADKDTVREIAERLKSDGVRVWFDEWEIRPGDSFFDLGGHSLLAVRAHREIREKLKLPKLSITDIFRFPTVRTLGVHLGGLDGGSTTPDDASSRAEPSAVGSTRGAMRRRARERSGPGRDRDGGSTHE